MPLPPAIEKRIKRQVTARQHLFFAITAPGLEALCAAELGRLDPPPATVEAVPGGVHFTGKLTSLYLANLHLRTATRILMRLTSFKATRFEQLQHHLEGFPWELYLFGGMPVEVHASARHSRLYHRAAISQRVAAAVSQRLKTHGVAGPKVPVAQRLQIRMDSDRATLSVDSSGEALYKRGYKTQGAQASIRETLAAAVLLWAGYRPELPLVDPLCGGGTFSMEAALLSLGIPPGLRRAFSFEGWPAFRPNHWRHLRQAAEPEKITITTTPRIFASDREAAACQALEREIERNGLKPWIRVSRREFESLKPGDLPQTGARRKGLVVLNPPYGIRLGSRETARQIMVAMARHLRAHWKGWRVAVILPEKKLAHHFGPTQRLTPLRHGGLDLTLLLGKIS